MRNEKFVRWCGICILRFFESVVSSVAFHALATVYGEQFNFEAT